MNTYELYGPPRVGGDCLSYCGKCKIELAHVIVSMLNGRPARVECKTCKSQHNHKGAAPVTRKSSSSSAATPKKVTVRVREVWEQKMQASRGKVPLNYNVKDVFKKGDVIQHVQFGLGFVEEVKLGGKITVLFSETEKVLIHGMGQATTPTHT